MGSQKYYYLVHIQYLGFRFSGWAKQPKVKTVHYMIDKTLLWVFGHENFKTMAVAELMLKCLPIIMYLSYF